jgi:hypothetical protein
LGYSSNSPNRGHQTFKIGSWDTALPIWPFWSFLSPFNQGLMTW